MLEFLLYILDVGKTPAPEPETTTASIVVQASSLQKHRFAIR
jgi:hypothetical protein